MKINNCENCHHFNNLIHWEEGIFYQCLRGNNLWIKCNDYDPIHEEDIKSKVEDLINKHLEEYKLKEKKSDNPQNYINYQIALRKLKIELWEL